MKQPHQPTPEEIEAIRARSGKRHEAQMEKAAASQQMLRDYILGEFNFFKKAGIEDGAAAALVQAMVAQGTTNQLCDYLDDPLTVSIEQRDCDDPIRMEVTGTVGCLEI